MVDTLTACPLKRTGMMALGWIRRCNSVMADLAKIPNRTHLIPPAVEPEEAPINMMNSTITHSRCGQREQSEAANPQLVIAVTTTKNDFRKAHSMAPHTLSACAKSSGITAACLK